MNALLNSPERVEGSVDTTAVLSNDSSFVDPIRGHRLSRWTVEADSGKWVVVRVRSSDVDAVLYVLRDGEVQYSDDYRSLGSDSQIEFVMPDSGKVTVLAGSYSADTGGEYSLVVEEAESDYSRLLQEAPPESRDTPLSVPDLVSDSLSSADRSSFVDPIRGHRLSRWTVEADSGKRVVVRARSSDVDAVLYVLRDGEVQYSDDYRSLGSDSQIEFVMPDSGKVTVLAGSYSADTGGEYSLVVEEAESDYSRLLQEAQPESRDTPLSVPDLVSDSLSSADRSSFVDPIRGHRLSRWTVEADSGKRVVVRARSSDVDAVLYVLRDGEVQYSDDYRSLGSDSQIEFVMPDSGKVTVLAGSYSADTGGEYSLVVEEAESDYSRLLQEAQPESRDTPLSVPDLVSDSLSSADRSSFVDPIRGHRLSRWTVEADSGKRVVVRARSSDVDAVLYVLRDGEVQYSDDYRSLGSDSQIEFVMPDSGKVTVLAGSYSADTRGEYSLVVEEAESDYSRLHSRLLQEAPEPQGTLTLITKIDNE